MITEINMIKVKSKVNNQSNQSNHTNHGSDKKIADVITNQYNKMFGKNPYPQVEK